MKKKFVVAMCAMVFAGLSAGPALAGEIKGPPGSERSETGAQDHGRSWCLYSGLDDEDEDGFGRTQNWGSIPKEFRDFLTSIGEHPGIACNAHLNPHDPGAEH